MGLKATFSKHRHLQQTLMQLLKIAVAAAASVNLAPAG
jgi:hypothetical protein